MSDARLRELERRWKETNSPDDEAAYLLERVRVGDLTRERLELAAYCGELGPVRAVGVIPRVRALECSSVVSGRPLLLQVTLRVAEAAARGQNEAYQTLIRVAREWIACPCEVHAAECEARSMLFGSPHKSTLALAAAVAWASDRFIGMLKPTRTQASYVDQLMSTVDAEGAAVADDAARRAIREWLGSLSISGQRQAQS